MDSRRCSRCHLTKPISEFNRKNSGYQSRCRDCCAIIQRQIRYGISDEQWTDLMTAQDGVCVICGKPDRIYNHLSVDHNHVTGEVRGLLCGHCNHIIGKADEDPDILRRAAQYLEEKNGK